MKYVIVGNSDYAKLLFEYASELMEIVAFTVDAEFVDDTMLLGLPVISFDEIEMHYTPEAVEMLMAVGYTEMNDIREKLYNQYHLKGYRFASYIHPSVIVGSDCVIGEGNVFFEGVIIEKGCLIGKLNAFFFGTMIGHDGIIGNFNSFSKSSTAGRVKIGNSCFLGMGSVVSSDVVIGDYVLVGAMTYVTTNIEDGRAVIAEKSRLIDRDISKRII